MRKFLFLLLVIFSCHNNGHNNNISKPVEDTSKEAIKAKYLKLAKQTDEYKLAWIEVQKLQMEVLQTKDSSEYVRDFIVDEYNNNIGSTLGNVDNISELQAKLKDHGKDYLKVIQLNVAQSMLLRDMADAHAKTDTSE